MKALALAVPILASSVYAAPTLPARDALSSDAKPTGTATSKVRVTRRSAAYWPVTLGNPPLHLIGPDELRELAVVEQIEADSQVQVVVFDSAVPGYFSAHYDHFAPLTDTTGMLAGRTGMHPVPDLMTRLSRLPIVTIASVRGRATGIGSELILACDMRYASREKAVLGRPGDVERRLGRYRANFGK